jgi:hypothetical protein
MLIIKLLMVDLGQSGNPSLKVWEGRALTQTARLQDCPTSIATFVVADSTAIPGASLIFLKLTS